MSVDPLHELGTRQPWMDDSRAAKEICALCPVRRQCLESALARREPHGVFGGKTEFERRQILKERKSAS